VICPNKDNAASTAAVKLQRRGYGVVGSGMFVASQWGSEMRNDLPVAQF
jgi:hypothetical protein